VSGGSSVPLARQPCVQQCRWRGTQEWRGGLRLFRCGACGSEWVRTQPWAPVDADGSRDPELLAELTLRPPARPRTIT
jgi:hypothetical protein